jgi:hypothetical protein
MIAELSPDLSFWIGAKIGLKDLDTMPLVPSAGFRFGDGTTHRAVVVPIAHPSLPNGGRRKPRGFSSGHRDEVEVVQAGWTKQACVEGEAPTPPGKRDSVSPEWVPSAGCIYTPPTRTQGGERIFKRDSSPKFSAKIPRKNFLPRDSSVSRDILQALDHRRDTRCPAQCRRCVGGCL